MPRRKKSAQSPARVSGGPPEGGGSLGHHHTTTAGHRLPQGIDGAMANKLSGSDKDNMVRSMREMFSHLDPEVIYIVLSESDFKVENAMDSLLELSVAAEVAVPAPSPVSGFERTAAALLSPSHFSEPRPDPDSSRPAQLPSSPPSTTLLTEDIDLLVDQELETLNTEQDFRTESHTSQYLSTFPPPPFPQQVLPELLQSSLQPGSRGAFVQQQGPVDRISGASSPLDQLSTLEGETAEEQQSTVDFTHLMNETHVEQLKPPLDLAASGRPSAFQLYKKKDPSHSLSEQGGVMPLKEIVGGARSKLSMPNQEPLGYMPPWNLEAPVFSPRCHGNQGPTFITPVVQTSTHWPSQPRLASPWPRHSSISQAPLRPSATIPKSWALPAAPKPPAQHSRLCLEGKVLVLLRGAPGSGKSTLARALVEHNPGGVKLSTDDYFTRNGEYHFEPTALGEAHEWNHKRAKEAFERGANPIIIDNTNLQGWEMRPYVVQALRHGYKVLFREPDTWWKNKPRELERRSTHNVPVETIRRMLNGYERYVTVQSIMGSQMPDNKQALLLENRSSQLVSSGTPCPDLVGQPGLSVGCQNSRPQLFSSLPDVSSIGCTDEVGMLEDCTNKSTESLNFHPTGSPKENPELSNRDDDVDLGDLDSELDTQFQSNPSGDHSIPDCIVESVMNEDHRGDEVPVAFSESIRQREKRERSSRRSDFERLEPADLIKDTKQPDSKTKDEAEGVDMLRDGREKGTPQMLDFVGDWPSEGSLEQRPARRRERLKERNGGEDNANNNEANVQSGPNVAEFQKLLDLIQTSSLHLPPLSPNLGEECGQKEDEEAYGSREESLDSRSDDLEEQEQNMDRLNSSRCELPDCVLDWKAADSSNVKELRIDHDEGLQTKTENVLETDREISAVDVTSAFSAMTVSPLDLSETLEADVCADGVGSNNNEGMVESGDDHTDVNTNTCTENRAESDGSLVSEVCLSPVCESSVEGESPFSGGSQERKQRQGRRSGKQCKLALTFTQNCPGTSMSPLECPNPTAQSINSSQNSTSSDVDPSLDPNYNSGLSKSKSEALLQPHSPSPPPFVEGCFSQTEPQDFALLWRLNHHNGPNDLAVNACSHPNNITILSGDSSRFVPELSSAISAAVAVHPSSQSLVPYRVVHEKGTQVEEKELGTTEDRLESLRILSRHFKLVSFDTLEDLYDKCQQDLDWTTNLLLDSGEKFFRDEDFVKEEKDGALDKDKKTSASCRASGIAVETSLFLNVLDGHHPEDWPEGKLTGLEETTDTKLAFGAVGGSDRGSNTVSENGDQSDTTPNLDKPPETELTVPQAKNEEETCVYSEHKETTQTDLQGGAWGWSFDDGVIIEDSRIEIEDEIASIDEIHRVLQADEMERRNEERHKEKERTERRLMEERRSRPLDIQSVELKLPTEVGLQLTELFGPVGVDPATCSSEDYTVQMDLNLAKLLHQKWKETIQEKQRQATLSFHLLGETSVHWGESQAAKQGTRERTQPANFLISADGYSSLDSPPEAHGQMPFMDHWNTSRPHVSLRDIIKEEQALQENVEKTRQSRADLDRRDGSTLLKETQLFSRFPTMDKHFLLDIFRDHNYSLTQTELFLHSLLDEEPVKTVVAPEAPRSDHHRTASKERDKRQKPPEMVVPHYQDTEDPEYEDYRAEASLQRKRQVENFTKAAEAFKQGRKDVASFYAQQGHLHGKKMREANHRAAVQIFERVNSSLLPNNILDLHGLHVDEALEHLAQVLENKATDCEQGLCRPQLSVITGRGNHSQGGVARIRPAVLDYLTNKHYRFTEPKPGLVLVSLK